MIEYVSRYVLTEEGRDSITVNAAPYATGFYAISYFSYAPCVSNIFDMM